MLSGKEVRVDGMSFPTREFLPCLAAKPATHSHTYFDLHHNPDLVSVPAG